MLKRLFFQASKEAPKAPMPEASVGEATPAKMEPKHSQDQAEGGQHSHDYVPDHLEIERRQVIGQRGAFWFNQAVNNDVKRV
jgi:hypothetical protein